MPLACGGDTYICYTVLEILPVILSYIAVLPIIFLPYFLLCKCIKHTRLPQWYLNFITTIVEHVFRNILEKSEDEEGKEKFYTMFKFKAPPSIIYWLYGTLVQVIILAFIQFWDEFLLEESFGCSTDKYTACFSRDWPY